MIRKWLGSYVWVKDRHMLRKSGIVFFIAIALDFFSMAFYKQFEQTTADFIYFTGQSLSRLFYIWTIYIYTKEYFVINLIAAVWIGFALSDSLEELFFDNTKFDKWEYVAFALSAYIVIWKVVRKNLRNNSD